jgi:hypothetical protein
MGFKIDGSKISLSVWGPFCLEFLKLLGPEMRRRYSFIILGRRLAAKISKVSV